MNKPNEKHTKEKNTITIHKILHKLLDEIKLFYEICKVLKSIIKLFFWWSKKSRCCRASAFCCDNFVLYNSWIIILYYTLFLLKCNIFNKNFLKTVRLNLTFFIYTTTSFLYEFTLNSFWLLNLNTKTFDESHIR